MNISSAHVGNVREGWDGLRVKQGRQRKDDKGD